MKSVNGKNQQQKIIIVSIFIYLFFVLFFLKCSQPASQQALSLADQSQPVCSLLKKERKKKEINQHDQQASKLAANTQKRSSPHFHNCLEVYRKPNKKKFK